MECKLQWRLSLPPCIQLFLPSRPFHANHLHSGLDKTATHIQKYFYFTHRPAANMGKAFLACQHLFILNPTIKNRNILKL